MCRHIRSKSSHTCLVIEVEMLPYNTPSSLWSTDQLQDFYHQPESMMNRPPYMSAGTGMPPMATSVGRPILMNSPKLPLVRPPIGSYSPAGSPTFPLSRAPTVVHQPPPLIHAMSAQPAPVLAVQQPPPPTQFVVQQQQPPPPTQFMVQQQPAQIQLVPSAPQVVQQPATVQLVQQVPQVASVQQQPAQVQLMQTQPQYQVVQPASVPMQVVQQQQQQPPPVQVFHGQPNPPTKVIHVIANSAAKAKPPAKVVHVPPNYSGKKDSSQAPKIVYVSRSSKESREKIQPTRKVVYVDSDSEDEFPTRRGSHSLREAREMSTYRGHSSSQSPPPLTSVPQEPRVRRLSSSASTQTDQLQPTPQSVAQPSVQPWTQTPAAPASTHPPAQYSGQQPPPVSLPPLPPQPLVASPTQTTAQPPSQPPMQFSADQFAMQQPATSFVQPAVQSSMQSPAQFMMQVPTQSSVAQTAQPPQAQPSTQPPMAPGPIQAQAPPSGQSPTTPPPALPPLMSAYPGMQSAMLTSSNNQQVPQQDPHQSSMYLQQGNQQQGNQQHLSQSMRDLHITNVSAPPENPNGLPLTSEQVNLYMNPTQNGSVQDDGYQTQDSFHTSQGSSAAPQPNPILGHSGTSTTQPFQPPVYSTPENSHPVPDYTDYQS